MTTRAKAAPATPPFPTVTEASHGLALAVRLAGVGSGAQGWGPKILSAKWLETIMRPCVALPGGTKSTPPDKTLSAAPGGRAAHPDCRVARHRGPTRARPTAPAKTKITASHACTQSGWLPGWLPGRFPVIELGGGKGSAYPCRKTGTSACRPVTRAEPDFVRVDLNSRRTNPAVLNRRSEIVRANYNAPACHATRPRGALIKPLAAHPDRGRCLAADPPGASGTPARGAGPGESRPGGRSGFHAVSGPPRLP
jgi:hypothetical protein